MKNSYLELEGITKHTHSIESRIFFVSCFIFFHHGQIKIEQSPFGVVQRAENSLICFHRLSNTGHYSLYPLQGGRTLMFLTHFLPWDFVQFLQSLTILRYHI